MQTVVKRQGDPLVYLFAQGQWYFYNPADKPIGSGAMGDVYRGYSCTTRRPIAVKRVKDAFANNPMIRERARQEASLSYRHPNLVEMLGCCEYARDKGPIFILSNFVNGTNVDGYMKFLKTVRCAWKRHAALYILCSMPLTISIRRVLYTVTSSRRT